VLLGNGDGSFQPAQSYAAGPSPVSVAVGDFNGDGFPDLAVANDNAGTVSVLLNAADWNTGSPAVRAPSGQPARHRTAVSQFVLDTLSADYTVHDSRALAQRPLMTTNLQSEPARLVPMATDGGGADTPRAASNPQLVVTARHARDAAFERWGDTLGDLLSVSLLWPGRR
jgi:hypothetical protein